MLSMQLQRIGVELSGLRSAESSIWQNDRSVCFGACFGGVFGGLSGSRISFGDRLKPRDSN